MSVDLQTRDASVPLITGTLGLPNIKTRRTSLGMVDILGVPYRLAEIDQLAPFGGLAHAYCDHIRCEIGFHRDSPHGQRLYLLLHELLHVLSYQGHLSAIHSEETGLDDEGRIDALASLMTDFLKANPALIAAVMAEKDIFGGARSD